MTPASLEEWGHLAWCGNTHCASLPLSLTGATAGQQGSEPGIGERRMRCLTAEFEEHFAISFAKNTKGFPSARTGGGNFSSHLALETVVSFGSCWGPSLGERLCSLRNTSPSVRASGESNTGITTRREPRVNLPLSSHPHLPVPFPVTSEKRL